MLIQCPNCKKPVSDQAKNCIHCNYLLKQTPSEQLNTKQTDNYPLIDYSKISKREKLEIIERFGKDFPTNSAVLKKSFNLKKIMLFLTFAMMAVIFCAFLIIIPYSIESPNFKQYEQIAIVAAVCLVVILLILLITFIIFGIISTKLRPNESIAYANFIKWAKLNNIFNITPPAYVIIKNKEGV